MQGVCTRELCIKTRNGFDGIGELVKNVCARKEGEHWFLFSLKNVKLRVLKQGARSKEYLPAPLDISIFKALLAEVQPDFLTKGKVCFLQRILMSFEMRLAPIQSSV